MKKIFVLLLVAVITYACGKDNAAVDPATQEGTQGGSVSPFSNDPAQGLINGSQFIIGSSSFSSVRTRQGEQMLEVKLYDQSITNPCGPKAKAARRVIKFKTHMKPITYHLGANTQKGMVYRVSFLSYPNGSVVIKNTEKGRIKISAADTKIVAGSIYAHNGKNYTVNGRFNARFCR